ncbi:MAG: bifunctional riboflavin kinase/FAD synthetase [Firmicutes bacterium]|nr:bifunctional riboflavin kinase/FAD synthetase [Bacillota bacterium]
MDGFINLYKPKDFTSHDALNIVRRNFRGTKIGHGGTLDPDATGVLPVCIGKGTKLQDLVMGGDKAYEADVIFGLTSVSLDCGSEVTVTDENYKLDTDRLDTVVKEFIGKQEQFPPMVSAIKRNGVPLYKLARKGETVDLDSRSIEIYDLKLLEVYPEEKHPRIRIAVKCSKGTYIRSLGRDIGEAMGTTAVIDRLNRSVSGMFNLENAYTMDQVKEFCERKDYSFIIPMESAVKDLPRYDIVRGEHWKAMLDGTSIPVDREDISDICVYDPSGDLLAIGEVSEGMLKPKKILWEKRKRKQTMKYVTDLSDFSLQEDSAVVIGNFDGVHLGHRYLMEHCIKNAEKFGILSVVLTFSPHPKEYFFKEKHRYLQSKEKKRAGVDELGADYLISAPFSDIADMDADTFITTILLGKLKAKHIYVGNDFHFGKNGVADTECLREKCEEYGICVHVSEQLTYRNKPISSSRIKKELESGNIIEVARLMGQPYTVEGEVVHGREIGRTIGFPTANLNIESYILTPRSGVYAAQVKCGDKKYHGVACVGSRPTIEEGQDVNLEVHILDFDEDLYGKNIAVTLLSFIRGEKKFASLDELKAAITEDTEKTKKYFQKRGSASCNRK